MTFHLQTRGSPYRPHNVLVIEDDPAMRENLLELLENEGFEASGVADGARGVAAARADRPSLILCDLRLPILDGYGVLREIRARPETRSTPFILLTASDERTAVRTGMTLGADDYLTKPFARRELLGSIEARLRATQPPSPPRPHESGGERHLVMADPKTRALFEVATLAGRSSLPVLVTGEAGAGKSTLASHVHRATGDEEPLAVVRCGEHPWLGGALPRANTVLLDDLDELSTEGQRELVQLIDVRGRTGTRFLATARSELARLVEAGRFREDLLHRIDGFRLHVPRLRERPVDILPLAEHVLAPHRAELSACATRALSAYGFPGNIRELESGLERAAVLAGAGSGAPRALVRRDHLGVMAGARPDRPAPVSGEPGRIADDERRRLGTFAPRPLRGRR